MGVIQCCESERPKPIDLNQILDQQEFVFPSGYDEIETIEYFVKNWNLKSIVTVQSIFNTSIQFEEQNDKSVQSKQKASVRERLEKHVQKINNKEGLDESAELSSQSGGRRSAAGGRAFSKKKSVRTANFQASHNDDSSPMSLNGKFKSALLGKYKESLGVQNTLDVHHPSTPSQNRFSTFAKRRPSSKRMISQRLQSDHSLKNPSQEDDVTMNDNNEQQEGEPIVKINEDILEAQKTEEELKQPNIQDIQELQLKKLKTTIGVPNTISISEL